MPLPKIDFSAAQRLCTESELRLLQASAEERLSRLTLGELRRHITEARRLRDRWQEESTRQRRPIDPGSHRIDRVSPVRSRQKADLFAAAVSRFEAQLGKLGDPVARSE